MGSPWCSHQATSLSKKALLSGITWGGLWAVGGPTWTNLVLEKIFTQLVQYYINRSAISILLSLLFFLNISNSRLSFSL